MEQIIRQAIEDDGRTVEQLEAASGVDKGIISRFSKGKRTLRLPTVEKLCKTLHLELRRKRSR